MKRARSEEKSEESWVEETPTLLVYTGGELASMGYERVVAFDMDDTLIGIKSGKKFPTGRSDWKWLFGAPEKLRAEHARGDTKLVVFTNQLGVGKKGRDRAKEAALTGKVADLVAELGVPVQVFMAIGEDRHRKPGTGMWETMVAKYNCGVQPCLADSLYVGDAAGRPAAPGRAKDFSCSDRKFAFNVGVPFQTPEEYFEGAAPGPFDWEAPDLAKLEAASAAAAAEDPFTPAEGQEMVLLVGFPGCGKSTFARECLVPRGYVHVNRDTLKTPAKCLAATEAALKGGKSVVVDNTNPSASARAVYVNAAKAHKVPVRCVHFDVPEDVANHLNYYRERLGTSPHVPRIAYAVFKKQYEAPALSEGFTTIIERPLVLKFPDEHSKRLFFQYC